jgi:hypothetical protein
MVHALHDKLPGYDERQIFHDGCKECERRGNDLRLAMQFMDSQVFTRAWERAFYYHAPGMDRSNLAISSAEEPLLAVLWYVQLQLADRGLPLDGKPPRRFAK